jgi:hypothetical protein
MLVNRNFTCLGSANDNGMLHVVFQGFAGNLYSSTRLQDGDGTWITEDLRALVPGVLPYASPLLSDISCAGNDQGEFHICAVNNDGGVVHTMRRKSNQAGAEGPWQEYWGDVVMASNAPKNGLDKGYWSVHCAAVGDELQVVFLSRPQPTQPSEAYHTIRRATGAWTQATAMGDVLTTQGSSGGI